MVPLLHGDVQDLLQDRQEGGIQEPEEQREERADQKNDDGILVQLFLGGPDDLLQLGSDTLEILAELTGLFCLCSCICHCFGFLSLLFCEVFLNELNLHLIFWMKLQITVI